MIGRTISHYHILDKLGEGGMGAVYKARDSHLDRFVAIKVLPPERIANSDRKRRFVQEAKAASALIHPNIITIYDIDSVPGLDFIAMELVEGQSLDRVIAGQRLALKQALGYAVQIASALARTHAAGILHRDLKPSNIMITGQGLVKILDFGLAKLTEPIAGEDEATRTLGPTTEAGMILGTVAYMSPEQAEGQRVDARSDIFSFGSVLYEMLTGRPAFQGSSKLSTMSAILRDTPAALRTFRTDIPPELDRILGRCLAKDRNARYPSAAALHADLVACQERLAASEISLRSVLHRPRLMIAALAMLALLLAGFGWFAVRAYRNRWVRTTALPEIARLTDSEKYIAAFRLARQVDHFVPDEPELARLRREIWMPVSIYTEPPGADVFIRDYAADRNDWEPLGKSPLENLHLPAGDFCIRIAKPGFEEVEGTFDQFFRQVRRTLHPVGTAPGMVFVPINTFAVPPAGPVKAGPFWIDKYEVTNRQFKEFVDRGGYRKREFWKHPFVESGRISSWEDAMARFVDSTGQPGPATWELGSFVDGHADYPVGGVSWYEAAAYAEFASKRLPTVYHWAAAAAFASFSTILQLSNFQGQGPARIGSWPGVGRWGTYDMAGNVTEWCWNPMRDGRRCVRGGAWSDPNYMYHDMDAASPFERGPTRGFRCAQFTGPLPEALLGPFDSRPAHDYRQDRPVNDDVFRAYKSVYAYDRAELKPHVESVDDTSPWWRKERVSFTAAYANERVVAFVFLPRNAAPPYQTVLYFPGSTAQRERTSQNLELRRLDFVLRSGRAVVYPIYKGTYERHLASTAAGPNDQRDLVVAWAKDLSRCIDYVETRPDLDHEQLGFLGVSLGGEAGPIFSAIEPRLKTSILQSGGLGTDMEDLPGEANPINFLPRVKIPVLMINGRNDFFFPLEQNQAPMFRLLGTPDKQKRHAVFASGHVVPRAEVIKEVLPWLDRHLGPVKRKEP